jgi:excinuclease ABC subunit B
VEGKAILYADKITDSMSTVINETERRRKVQKDYNEKHGITPKTIEKELKPLVDPELISTQGFDLDEGDREEEPLELIKVAEEGIKYQANPAMDEITFESKEKFMSYLEDSMRQAAKNMEFEEAARIRDQIEQLKGEL